MQTTNELSLSDFSEEIQKSFINNLEKSWVTTNDGKHIFIGKDGNLAYTREQIEQVYGKDDNINLKQIWDESFNISGKYPKSGMPFKDVKNIYTDGEFKGKKVSKQVEKDAENLYESALSGNLKNVKDIYNKYFSEWNKSHSLRGTQQNRFVSIDTSKIALFNAANMLLQKVK